MQATLGTLYQFHIGYERMRTHQPEMYFLHRGKLQSFYDKNGTTKDKLIKRLTELENDFFVFDNGQIKYETKPTIPATYETVVLEKKTLLKPEVTKQLLITPEQKFNPEPVFLEGKTAEAYNEIYYKILSEPCNIL